jgi:hypothetical protein
MSQPANAERRMSDTATLLQRIANIRQRLGQAEGMLSEAHSATAALAAGPVDDPTLVDDLIAEHCPAAACESTAGPTRLTHRARRCLGRCQLLVAELRALGEANVVPGEAFRRAAAMAEAAVRCARCLPDSPGSQTRLCEGLDGLLDGLADHIGRLREAARRADLGNERIGALAHLLTGLAAGSTLARESFTALADAVELDARQGEPLLFFSAGPTSPAADAASLRDWQSRCIACHGLLTAQVVARIAPSYPQAGPPARATLAALVHDVGMLEVPAELLALPGRLSCDQRRTVELHAEAGARIVARQVPGADVLFDAIAQHHERLDGTGYPAGRRDPTPLARLLAVADVYAALVSPRPYRTAGDTRTALADVLLQARRGALDNAAADALAGITFYPIGSVVVLDDGSVAMVVATNRAGNSAHAPSRPVVALLADQDGRPVPGPQVVDLAGADHRSVVRALAVDVRRRLLADTFPQFA